MQSSQESSGKRQQDSFFAVYVGAPYTLYPF